MYKDQILANMYPGAIIVFHDGEEEKREARLAASLYGLEQFLEGAQAHRIMRS